MIVVSAATGQFGRLVTDRLMQSVPVSALAVAVRDPNKAGDLTDRGVDVRRGDYDEPDTLRAAFEGSDRLLFISSPSGNSSERMRQHHNVIDAARASGVGLVAYTSALGANLTAQGALADHNATERALRESGLPYVILRHPIYTDSFINPSLRRVIDAGELTSSSRGRGMNTATRADLAEAAAAVLASQDQAGKSYNFTGPLWTFVELAQVLSDIAGRTINYREVDADEGVMTMIGGPVRAGMFQYQTDDLERVLGHPATELRTAVGKALQTTATN
jgi:NAD(P)H dehydrogenase (quinone)